MIFSFFIFFCYQQLNKLFVKCCLPKINPLPDFFYYSARSFIVLKFSFCNNGYCKMKITNIVKLPSNLLNSICSGGDFVRRGFTLS